MVTLDSRPALPAVPKSPDDVPGWFWPLDQQLFSWLLERQTAVGQHGDLLEMGSYLGRSAILIGRHRQPGEAFTICDLFDSDAPDGDNAAEMTMSYRETLTRAAFERNYLAFHAELPTIVQAPTSALAGDVLAPGSCRFAHIDASHLYEHVAGDIQTARAALADDGIVVLDDFRSPHTPGVAAATWEAVFDHGLRPICLTPEKLYGTWADPGTLQGELLQLDGDVDGCNLDIDIIRGHQVLRFSGPGVAKLMPSGIHRDGRSAAPPRPAGRSAARRLALDLLPPIATRAVRRGLRSARERRA